MKLDLLSAVGFNVYYYLFPFFFFFYFLWLKILLLKKMFSRLCILKKFLLQSFSKQMQSEVSSGLNYSNFLISNFFIFLLYTKMWNLVPLSMGISSKLVWTLSFALFIWLVIKFSSGLKKFIGYFSHYTTLGSPTGLIPFIKVVEVISKVIRPITLGVRLAVNLLTGHLLLSMLSGLHVDYLMKGGFFMYLMMLLMGVGGFMYEFCVCLVQALVYALMISQYLDEHSC